MPKVTEICFIAPSANLYQKAKSIIEANKYNINVYKASLEDALTLVNDLAKQGAKIFISRGGTKAFIEKNANITVVNIPAMLSDYIDIIDSLCAVKGKIAFFSYEDNMADEVNTMCRVLKLNFHHYIFKNAEQTQSVVAQAVEDKVVLGVGGAVTAKIAMQYNLDYISLENSTKSIEAAIDTAKSLLEVKKQEQAKRERLNIKLSRYKAVFDFTHDAIISIDEKGCIDVINPVAQRLLKISEKSVIGKNIKEVIANTAMLDVLYSGKTRLGVLLKIKDKIFYSNCIPIDIEGKIKGVVSTFQDIETIQSSEQKIRIDLHQKGLVAKYSFDNILGQSQVIKTAINIAKSYAQSDARVLVYGETGTGKELFVQSICKASKRNKSPFIAINCATLEKNLLESEMFGYVEGAFTGAIKGGKAGLFELAHTGTIFLDEIAELPLDIQAKLLRVLQEKEIRRLGSSSVLPIDVRLIAATNKNLEQAVHNKMFREDLFYRLNVLTLYVPSLKERANDIQDLAEFFFKHLVGNKYQVFIGKLYEVLHKVRSYSWPGNIRELQNFVERLSVVLLNDGDDNRLNTLVEQLLAKERQTAKPNDVNDQEFKVWQKNHIIQILKNTDGNLNKAAAELNISRTTLWRKLKEYSIKI